MITTRIYLDTRRVPSGSPAPLKLVLTKNGVRALIPLQISVLPSQWDAHRQMVIGHGGKQQINSLLAERKLAVDNIIYTGMSSGQFNGLRASQIKDLVLASLFPSDADVRPLFIARFNQFVSLRSTGTQRVYRSTENRLRSYLGRGLDTLRFEDITPKWLQDFDLWLAKTAPSKNARNIHFRNIRAVFNDAITDEVITCYPFRKFKVTPEPTRKRALSVEQLRMLFSVQVEPHLQRYLDCFKITFLLIGINLVDLCHLQCITDEGRVEYARAKTHRQYTIKVERECATLLAQYQGQNQLLDYLDTIKTYRHFANCLSRALGVLRERFGLPGLTTYWARHSWATIAAQLDIPKETIAAALGHGGNTVTDIYIDFDRRKIDEANRRVIDWVMYNKK